MDLYYGHVDIPNFTKYSDGKLINFIDLKGILHNDYISSLSKIISACFNNNSPSITLPSTIYTISITSDHSSIVSTATVTTSLPHHLSEYKGSCYIYNVCTNINYRGQGYAHTLLNTLIKNHGYNHYMLDVYADNKSALKLYSKMGFQLLKKHYVNNRLAYLLELKL